MVTIIKGHSKEFLWEKIILNVLQFVLCINNEFFEHLKSHFPTLYFSTLTYKNKHLTT